MLKIALYNPVFDTTEFHEALREFSDVQFTVAEELKDIPAALDGAEILITGNRFYTSEPAALIREHGKSLRWLAFVTSGVDKAVASGLPKGVIVTNVAGMRAFAVAEQALALMLGLVRHIRATEQVRLHHHWARDDVSPNITNLARKHLVIVGTGAIGQDIARKAKAFDMHVTGISRRTDPLLHFNELRTRDALVATARQADVLLVAALAGPETDGMITREVIAAMKPTAFIVNIARGSLIDEPALIEALQAGRIAGAGLDVQEVEPLPPESPLWDMDNVLLTPHVGGAGDPGTSTHATMFIENLRLWLAGKRLNKIVIEKT
jgi:D-2-hydroxyacid dehydrogenase (NADP+)